MVGSDATDSANHGGNPDATSHRLRQSRMSVGGQAGSGCGRVGVTMPYWCRLVAVSYPVARRGLSTLGISVVLLAWVTERDGCRGEVVSQRVDLE